MAGPIGSGKRKSNTGASGTAAGTGNLSGSSTHQRDAKGDSNNPYHDASEGEASGSKRSTSARPKVPTLNFTKVLKQSSGMDN